ncbi:hypothetical protein [Sporosarcina sp. SG10008]|uniref:hypothetical protein n=1 Tax=Sporosarcina sp. SG10008 TaxID=3373103 RepID=UPI0037DCEEFB
MIRPVIDSYETLGETLLLVDIVKRYKKVENKETKTWVATNEFSHVYTVVCLERKFDKFDVKIEENKPLFSLGEDGKAVAIPDECYVKFENLTILPYVREGWIQLSAKADRCMSIIVE